MRTLLAATAMLVHAAWHVKASDVAGIADQPVETWLIVCSLLATPVLIAGLIDWHLRLRTGRQR